MSVLTIGSEFERIITLLAPESVSADGTEPLVLEETAEELSRMLHGLYAARHASSILPKPTLEMLYANVKLHKKYNIEITVVKQMTSFTRSSGKTHSLDSHTQVARTISTLVDKRFD